MTKHLTQSAMYALIASVTIVSMAFMVFFVAEPQVGIAQVDSNEFYIRQTITDETSFLVQPTNVTMAGSINGVTGGNATGSTQFVVTTNNTAGYNVTIAYENNGTPEAMIGDVTANQALRDYDGDVGGEPSYNFVASTSSQFAYTVTSTTTSDTDQSFLSNGSNTCNTGSTDAAAAFCWKSPAVAGFGIVDRSTAAVTGATSSIYFKVHVPSGADPVPQAETYTATATLTLTAN